MPAAWKTASNAAVKLASRSCKEIRIPTLVMAGAQDRIVPAANAQQLADSIPGARLVIFPHTGHAYIADATRAANQEVLQFLAGIPGPVDGSSTGPRPATNGADT